MRFLARRWTLPAVLLATGLLALVTGAAPAGDEPPRTGKTRPQWADAIGDRLLPSWVEKHVQEWQVTAADRRFDDIGWAKDIRDALGLAKKHERPIFLFTHNGRMAIGRC